MVASTFTDLFSDIGAIIDLVWNSLVTVFTVLGTVLNNIFDFISSLPNIVEYGIGLTLSVFVSVAVLNLLKGLL